MGWVAFAPAIYVLASTTTRLPVRLKIVHLAVHALQAYSIDVAVRDYLLAHGTVFI